MFDEISLKNHLQYNPRVDLIEGFQDHGVQGRSAQPVSYGLVFMVAGIRKRIKQPIAYYLSGSSVTAERLTALIKEWQYFQEVYSAEKCLAELRFFHKLTEEHLIPDKIKKMRVKTAAQVFSHSVAVVTEHLSARLED
ncbi:hypothetical protein ABMA27_003186 [Loxostege sticticalis]|uniref:Transposable element P transposase-like RNase H domain-containing protein n=1 Tax=Loxostege sticticalis TaxID=481309 RepID=A0ABR3HSB0_LOXSC